MSSVAQPHPTVPAGATEVDVKQALRTAIRSTRSIRSPRVQAEVAERLAKVTIMIPDVAQASCVALYASRAGEPGTLPLIEQLVAKGKRVLLPVLGPSLERGWAEFTDAEDLRERAPGRPPSRADPTSGPRPSPRPTSSSPPPSRSTRAATGSATGAAGTTGPSGTHGPVRL